MIIFPRAREDQPQSGPSNLSELALSLGFTHGFNFGDGSVKPLNAANGAQGISVVNNASAAAGPGGRAVQFAGTSSDRLEIAGNPFATSTCTYLWVESGIDATTGTGQSLTESRYSTLNTSEQGSLQIRLTNGNIQIVQAQVAVTLTGTGARDNTGKVNVCALSVAGNNGRHALFTGGNLITSASPASSYVHGTSAIGGGSDCPSSTIKTYVLLFSPKVIPDAILQDLTVNPWKLFQGSPTLLFAPVAGLINVTGTLASTLGNATLAASGAVQNAGGFASTLGNATMAAAGSVGTAPSGTLASTLAAATMSSAGAVTNAGSFATSLAGASMSAAGIVINRGTFSATMGDATMTAAGTVAPNATGTFSSTLDGATMTAYGYNGVPPVLAGFFHRLPKTPRHVQRIP